MALRVMETSKAGRWRACVMSVNGLPRPVPSLGAGARTQTSPRGAHMLVGDVRMDGILSGTLGPAPRLPWIKKKATNGSEQQMALTPEARPPREQAGWGSQGMTRGSLPRPGERHWRKMEEQSPEAGENVTCSGHGHRVKCLQGWLRPGWGGRQGPDHKGSCGPHQGGWAS